MELHTLNHIEHKPVKYTDSKMVYSSLEYLNHFKKRRTVRNFSDKSIQEIVMKNCMKVADLAPSGANKQPWKFVCINSQKIKSAIRVAAEKEEKLFYEKRAPKTWPKT